MRELSDKAVGVYVAHRGEKMGGLVLIKIDNLERQCRLITQQRNLDGVLEWVDVFQESVVDAVKADEYISRSIGRDPDLWVIEIEDKEMKNPFKD